MNLVIFTHPKFVKSQSMPRFAKMLTEGMTALGHDVEVWSPEAFFFRLPFPQSLKKWLGYLDQYILFPIQVKKKIKNRDIDTLYVFADQALGPWIPLVADKPHVVHCHDFLAQRSALGEISENLTEWTGRIYQNFIRRGFKKADNFISVSKNTRKDLHRFLDKTPKLSKVVYNGLNGAFKLAEMSSSRKALSEKINVPLQMGYILHVGGNQWYKNRVGVIEIYEKWRLNNEPEIPLLLIGAAPNSILRERYERAVYKKDIYFLYEIDDEYVKYAYSGASLFLFPSLAEGFGWPIAEAMASAVPVITTGEAPMTEVAEDSGVYIPVKPHNEEDIDKWAEKSAEIVKQVFTFSASDRNQLVKRGLENIKRFDSEKSLKEIEKIYLEILE